MERLFPVKKAVKTTTVQEMVAPIIYFRFPDAFHGKPQHPQHIFDQVLIFRSSGRVLHLVLYCILTVHPEVCWCALQKIHLFPFFGWGTV